MQFVGKFGQIISWCPFWEIRNLPHSGDNLSETRSTNKLTRNQNIVILVLGCEQTERQRQRQGPYHCVYGDAPKWIWDRLGASSGSSP